MSYDPYNEPTKPATNKWTMGALIVVAVGIATAVWVSNGVGGQNGSVAQGSFEADPVVAAAIDSAAQGDLAAFRATANGSSYPEISFISAAGEKVGFDHFAGKVTLVNFWATWCAPCRAEMPALDSLAAKYADQGFQVATINLDVGDDGIQKAKAFMDEVGLKNLPLHADPSFEAFETLKKRGVALGLPATLLLGPDGHEWGVLAGPAEWNSEDAFKLIDAALAQASKS
ncbi:TlpA family protein disulfide reductase [Maritalea sp.]|uniref:TlpA family protein disulfide reductase n=1 Tax=Maritalea sp. TaxID=2003361 RepID=UPI003EF43139